MQTDETQTAMENEGQEEDEVAGISDFDILAGVLVTKYSSRCLRSGSGSGSGSGEWKSPNNVTF